MFWRKKINVVIILRYLKIFKGDSIYTNLTKNKSIYISINVSKVKQHNKLHQLIYFDRVKNFMNRIESIIKITEIEVKLFISIIPPVEKFCRLCISRSDMKHEILFI